MDADLAAHLEQLDAWRSLSAEDQAAYFASKAPKFDPGRHRANRLLVLGCDYRGGPATECGCTSTRICLAGKGRPIPGSDARDVADADCLACVGAASF